MCTWFCHDIGTSRRCPVVVRVSVDGKRVWTQRHQMVSTHRLEMADYQLIGSATEPDITRTRPVPSGLWEITWWRTRWPSPERWTSLKFDGLLYIKFLLCITWNKKQCVRWVDDFDMTQLTGSGLKLDPKRHSLMDLLIFSKQKTNEINLR